MTTSPFFGPGVMVAVFTLVYFCGFVLLVAIGAFFAIRFDRWLVARK
jgi:hypothetical protein